MQIYGWEFLTVSLQPDTLCDHMHFDNKDKKFLICHVTSRNHIFKGLFEFTDQSPSELVTILPCSVAISLVHVKIRTI